MQRFVISEFKRLTGFKQSDIAREFDMSKQDISFKLRNHSLLYKAASAYMLNTMIDKKIRALQAKIVDLNNLKTVIKTTVKEGDHDK